MDVELRFFGGLRETEMAEALKRKQVGGRETGTARSSEFIRFLTEQINLLLRAPLLSSDRNLYLICCCKQPVGYA